MDVNTYSMNKRLEKQSKENMSYELLLRKLEDDFEGLRNDIIRIKRIASDYDGIDFTEDIKLEITELINDTI